jgi:DNA-binding NarL/FixJ family response regulator
VSPLGSGALSLVLADDHTLFREGLAELIGLEDGFTVLGHADTGHQAIDLTVRLRPDLLLLDVQMPGPGPDAVIDQVARYAEGTGVVMLTMYDDPLLTARLLGRGAQAYLVKTTGREELLAVLRAVVCGRATDQAVLCPAGHGPAAPAGTPGTRPPLSARETQVLALLGRGYSNARIAAALGIAEATVKRHLTHVYNKLGVSSRVDALRLAYESQLLAPAAPPLLGPPV